jgi:hypothetical protein
VVPSSSPCEEAGSAEPASTVIVKSSADAVPPLSFRTCLTTVSVGRMSLLVTVQVLVCPMEMVPEQSVDSDLA